MFREKHDRAREKGKFLGIFSEYRQEQSFGQGLYFQMMGSADELCPLARLGQTAKIQKYLQTHSE